MRHGPEIDEYELRHPGDPVLTYVKEALAKLASRSWERMPQESDLEFKQRVEQSYHSAYESLEDINKVEQIQSREEFLAEEKASIKERWTEANLRTRDAYLRVGGREAMTSELGGIARDVENHDHKELKDFGQEVDQKMGDRNEYANHFLIAPALDQKLKELGLDQVQEPVKEKTPSQEIIKEPSQENHILGDVMGKAAMSREARNHELLAALAKERAKSRGLEHDR